MQNWRDTLLSQYASSPSLLALIEGANDAIDPAADITRFFQQVWNLDTATGWGLDVWGRILGVSRNLQVPAQIDYFGFQTDALPERSLPFNVGVFYAGAQSTSTYALSDGAYRSLLYFKAFSNICATTIPSLNFLINRLFGGVTGLYVARDYVIDGYFASEGSGRAFVEDLGNMEMRYVIEFELEPYQSAIVNAPGVLPHPAGVKVYIT